MPSFRRCGRRWRPWWRHPSDPLAPGMAEAVSGAWLLSCIRQEACLLDLITSGSKGPTGPLRVWAEHTKLFWLSPTPHPGADRAKCPWCVRLDGGPYQTPVGAGRPQPAAFIYRPTRAMATAVSLIRDEKPHSLSYQLITRTNVPPITLVSFSAKIEERGSWLKSLDTSSSS